MGIQTLALGDVTDGLSGSVSDVTQTVGPLGSSGPLQDIVNTSSLLDGLGVNNLDNVLGGSLGGDGPVETGSTASLVRPTESPRPFRISGIPLPI